jgi:NhaP-type Na+/H+ or K+/H+ antiporter
MGSSSHRTRTRHHTGKLTMDSTPAYMPREFGADMVVMSQGLARVMIGVQLVIAGYQLPAKYQWTYWKEMTICLLPVMTTMWLSTSGQVSVIKFI